MDLKEAVRRIAVALRHEADASPGGHLVYTRPHESGRARRVKRATMTGEPTGKYTRLPADCPKPVHGVCECPPEGNWRPVPGTQRPDESGYWTGEGWESYWYAYDPEDGYWRCTRPMARSLQRMKDRSPRRFTALMRLLDGETPQQAWQGLGSPADPVAAAESVVAAAWRVAREEAKSDYIRPPRKKKPRP